MTEQQTLIPVEEQLPSGVTDKDLDDLTKSSSFLPQLRVYGASSTLVKEGSFPMGHLGLYITSGNVLDLGEQVDSLVTACRPRAGIVSGDSPISYYDMASPSFVETKERAMAKEEGFMVGLEYLLYFPSIIRWGLFFMGNPTLRRESANVKALLGCAATIKVKFINPSTSKYSWHGVSAYQCTTPFDLPDMKEIEGMREEFRHPIDSSVELDTDSKSGGRER